MPSDAELERLFGPPVSNAPAALPPHDVQLPGRNVTLTGITKDDVPGLYRNLGSHEIEQLFLYIAADAPKSEDELWVMLEDLRTKVGMIVYAIKADPDRLSPIDIDEKSADVQLSHEETLGIIAYLNVHPDQRELEIGAVIFGPALQRTAAATEVMYLMLRLAFEDIDSQHADCGLLSQAVAATMLMLVHCPTAG